jgi:hypothetical protein
MLTAQVLLTTYKMNTDPQYASHMAQQVNQQTEELKREYEDISPY